MSCAHRLSTYGCCWTQTTLDSDKAREAERIQWEILRQDEHKTPLSGPGLAVPGVGGGVDFRRTAGVSVVGVVDGGEPGSDMGGNKTWAEGAAKWNDELRTERPKQMAGCGDGPDWARNFCEPGGREAPGGKKDKFGWRERRTSLPA